MCRPSCVVGRGTRRAHRRGRWGDAASNTQTTLRTSARRGGGAGAGRRLSSPSLPGMVHTRKPPYEQLLVGVVAGGVSSLSRRACVVVDVAVSTRDPTCEQLLAAGGRVLGCLGVVLVVVVVVVALSW